MGLRAPLFCPLSPVLSPPHTKAGEAAGIPMVCWQDKADPGAASTACLLAVPPAWGMGVLGMGDAGGAGCAIPHLRFPAGMQGR